MGFTNKKRDALGKLKGWYRRCHKEVALHDKDGKIEKADNGYATNGKEDKPYFHFVKPCKDT